MINSLLGMHFFAHVCVLQNSAFCMKMAVEGMGLSRPGKTFHDCISLIMV